MRPLALFLACASLLAAQGTLQVKRRSVAVPPSGFTLVDKGKFQTATGSTTITGHAGTGYLIYVKSSCYIVNGTDTESVPSDGTNAYNPTTRVRDASTNVVGQVYYAWNATLSSSQTLSAAACSSGFGGLVMYEVWSGAKTSGDPLDTTAGVKCFANVVSTNDVVTPNLTPTATGELIISAVFLYSATPVAETGGFGLTIPDPENIDVSGANPDGAIGYKVYNSTTPFGITWTSAGAGPSACTMAFGQ